MPIDRASFAHLDLAMLTTLVALVEERSTVGAAARLRLAQSTVSGTLARLREALGDPLLVRLGNAFEPTPKALALSEAVRPHLEALSAAIRAQATFDPSVDERTFAFGCTDAVGAALLPQLSARLREAAPRCAIVARVGDYRSLPPLLASGEVSAVLAYLRGGLPAACKTSVLRHSPWVLLRDARARPVTDLADFAARPHALVSPAGDLKGFVDDELDRRGLSRRIAIAVTSFALLAPIVAGSELVATVPDFVADALAGPHGLAVDPCPVAPPPVTNTLAWRTVVDADPAERWFRRQVRALFSVRSSPSGAPNGSIGRDDFP